MHRSGLATPRAQDYRCGDGISAGCLNILEYEAEYGTLPRVADPGADAVAVVLAERDMVLEQSGVKCAMAAGEWTLYRAACPVTLYAAGKVRIIVVPVGVLQVSRSQLLSNTLDRYSRDEPINRVTFSVLWALCEEAAQLAPGDGHDLARAAVHVLKNALRDHAGCRCNDKTLLLQRVRDFVEWHLREPDLSIGRVARAFNCTERSIQRAFQGQHETFARYVMHLRLERCHLDLLAPRLAHRSVTETAFSYGFVNLAHFSRAYKVMFGVSPRATRALRTLPVTRIDS
jgi:AraC-like DNA-binding protein